MVTLTNAILGNPNILVTMGQKAEINGIFYPQRDHAQNVDESLLCFYSEEFVNINKEKGSEYLLWLDDDSWRHDQKYVNDTYTVTTHLSHECGLNVTIIDTVHPYLPTIIRRFNISSTHDFDFQVFYYSSFNAGDSRKQNTCYVDADSKTVIQYWKNYHVGLSTIPEFESWQVSKLAGNSWWNNPQYDMQDGHLQNNREDIGDLGFVVGWNRAINKNKRFELTVYIGLNNNKKNLYKMMRGLITDSLNMISETVESNCETKLATKKPLKSVPLLQKIHDIDLITIYNRSLLTLDLLYEPTKGSFIASPEFDPDFEMSGGYGFCWNRDSVDMAQSLLNAGYPEYANEFINWCITTQLPEGSWFQRYWTDGKHAPSWSNFRDTTQIDETACTLFLIGSYYSTLTGIDRTEFLDRIWITVLRGAEYLIKRSKDHLHELCMDLWETHVGTFTYTNTSIYSGLMFSSQIARDHDQHELAARWEDHALQIKRRVLSHLWLKDKQFFARCFDENGNIDNTVDASILGTITPFALLSLSNNDEWEKACSIIETIEHKLSLDINGYHGIKRYEKDKYINGNPWTVTTLWLAKSMLILAKSIEDNKECTETKHSLVSKALKLIQWCIRGTNTTNLLPEQVDQDKGTPAWAIPLGWSCALMIDTILLLDELLCHDKELVHKLETLY
ncbi:glycoside hydrolase family 15 protein [Methanosalsum natronophilum]|uniref:glycoside hydrolase family 15 protein n=1 Tax=Methanosalsum natronophilum TaxID=768733 RepID=UPI002167C8FD|nr:glycoside hydrolase family 15 protein [Methanosalsum natronophilum]MCS3923332.1 oligosaccharide amylase [Methanosalsum natronophilum]